MELAFCRPAPLTLSDLNFRAKCTTCLLFVAFAMLAALGGVIAIFGSVIGGIFNLLFLILSI